MVGVLMRNQDGLQAFGLYADLLKFLYDARAGNASTNIRSSPSPTNTAFPLEPLKSGLNKRSMYIVSSVYYTPVRSNEGVYLLSADSRS